jgi:hypothetical protein
MLKVVERVLGMDDALCRRFGDRIMGKFFSKDDGRMKERE